MADDMTTKTMVTAVYYNKGKFGHAEGTPKLVKAPFDLIHMPLTDSGVFETFVQPCAFGAVESDWLNNTLTDNPNDQERGQGFVSDFLVIEEHELGGFDANPDDWRGCFSIGMI